MTWVFTKLPGVEKLIEYEAKLNYFFPESKSIAICQYNENKFKPEVLIDVIRVHPKVIIYDSICDNPYYIPPDEFIARMRGEINVKLYERIRDDIIVRMKYVQQGRRTENVLWESEEKYRTLVENVNIGVYRNTIGPKGHFLEANPAIVKMFGYDSIREFLSINVSDLYQKLEERKLFVDEILKKGFVKDKELRLKKKDGTPIWGSVTAKVYYDEKGEIKWIDGVIGDITERKKTEDELKQKIDALERFQKVAVGRELKMKELKAKIAELEAKLGGKL